MKPAKRQQIRQYKVVEHNVMGLTTPQNQNLLYGRHSYLVSQRQKSRLFKNDGLAHIKYNIASLIILDCWSTLTNFNRIPFW
jgi:hypothetical protein